MAEYNIAQIGTFDYENIGDLLFPTVLKAQLDKRIAIKNHFLFSLNNCTRPLDNEKLKVYSIDRLEEVYLTQGIDAIILGGGDLIRFDNKIVATDNYSSKNTAFDLVFYPILVANKYNIPLLWNCPGVPFEFTDDDKFLLKEYLEQVDYISVRDNKSRNILRGTGTEKNISVFPDSVLSISELVNVKATLENLKIRYGILANKYFVFQCFPAVTKEYADELKVQLKRIVDYYSLPIIFFPIGRVHNDHVFLKELIKDLNDDRFIYIEDKLTLTESCAILSGAELFIGTSLHGNVISNSYGVPSIALDAGNLIKVRNFFKLIDREEYCINNISNLKDSVDKVLRVPKLEKLNDAIQLINKHFDNLATEIEKKEKKPSFMEAFRKTYYHQNQAKNSLTFYFDCGDGFNQNNIKEIFYYSEGHIHADVFFPENCNCVRIDPIEGHFAIVKNLEITLDGNHFPYHHNGIDEDNILFYTIDPQITLNTTLKKHLSIDFDIEIMPNEYVEARLNEFLSLPEKITQLEEILEDTNTHVRNLEATITILEKKLNEKVTIISNMENSTSWKVTAPLRNLKEKTKK